MDGRSLPARRYRDIIQATETGWPCSTGFTNSFRRLGGSLAHVLELVAGEAWRRRPHGFFFFSNIRMTSSGISPGGAVMRSHSACVIVDGMGERTGAGSVVPSAVRPVPKFEVEVGVAAEQLQHAADGVGMVIVAVATVIDRVLFRFCGPGAQAGAALGEAWGGWAAGPSLARTAGRIPSKFRTWRDRSAYR